jgi:hypothetical protein
MPTSVSRDATYSGPIRRLAIFFVVVPDFVEIVLVQLADKAGEIAVFEVLREYVFCEFLVLCLCQQVWRADEGTRRIPLERQNCLRHSPIVLHSRRLGFPTS